MSNRSVRSGKFEKNPVMRRQRVLGRAAEHSSSPCCSSRSRPACGRFEAEQTFMRGSYMPSLEAGGGSQSNFEGPGDLTGLNMAYANVRFSLLPFETALKGTPLSGRSRCDWSRSISSTRHPRAGTTRASGSRPSITSRRSRSARLLLCRGREGSCGHKSEPPIAALPGTRERLRFAG
jgi:hypothetical protein